MAQETGQFQSISGVDINAVFGNYKFASLQMIRYATQREKGQIFTLGSSSARATARGKRSVSGACVFTMIDRINLVKAMTAAGGTGQQVFISNDELANYNNYNNQVAPNATPAQIAAFQSGTTLSDAGLINGATSFSPFVSSSIFNSSNFGQTTTPYLADQLLPFDITIVGTPEYGFQNSQRLIIMGVEIMSEASGTSIEDLVIEKQMSFIARAVADWTPLQSLNVLGTGSTT